MTRSAEELPPLVIVVGPTATGKSELAIRLARELQGEVISADSMQVYRHFDIGTGKLAPAERGGIEHHLIDVVEPEQPFSAARFVELADHAVREIRGRARHVVIAGGTGLYVKALVYGLFATPDPDPAIRAEHRRLRATQGLEALYQQLQLIDAEAAARIDARDFVRISRALEVYQQTGQPISQLRETHGFATPRYAAVWLGLAPAREALRQRIAQRVDAMMARGWLGEVERLVASGLGSAPPMGALGYRQLRAHLQGKLDLEEAVRQTKRDTWRYARRQLNWFRAEPRIQWYGDGAELDLAAVRQLLGQ